jgi:hypothetical protein
MSDPSALHNLLDVARQNIAVDAGFDLASFVQHASSLTDRGVSLYTLPITSFGRDSMGEDINTIDVPTIRTIVRGLVTGDLSSASTTSSSAPSPTVGAAPIPEAVGIVLNVVNGSPFQGIGTQLVKTFTKRGFTGGEVSTADGTVDDSTIAYGPGGRMAAEALAHQLNLTATPSTAVQSDTVQLTVGTDFPSSDYMSNTEMNSTTSTSTTPTTPVATISATASGTRTPAPTDLSRMTTDQAPCVK